jgi:hypothetical protein
MNRSVFKHPSKRNLSQLRTDIGGALDGDAGAHLKRQSVRGGEATVAGQAIRRYSTCMSLLVLPIIAWATRDTEMRVRVKTHDEVL